MTSTAINGYAGTLYPNSNDSWANGSLADSGYLSNDKAEAQVLIAMGLSFYIGVLLVNKFYI